MYKIICSRPTQGTERSLPYEFKEEEDAHTLVASIDNIMRVMGIGGYEHRVEEAQPQPVKFARRGKVSRR